MLTDPEPEGKGDAICVQCVQIVHEVSFGLTQYGDGYNLYFSNNNHLDICHWAYSGIISTLNNVRVAIQTAWCLLLVSGKARGKGICCDRNVYPRETCPQPDIEI